jgi:hypothetical protein
MQPEHETRPRHGLQLDVNLWGHGCIIVAICVLAALLSFPAGW